MTFDLKRARELVWAVSERKIWTLLERTGYGGDIDKRRERQAITEICDKQFPSAIAEIERLRVEMENYGDDYVCQMKSKDVRIQELEDTLVEERAKVIMLIEKLQLVANDPDWQSKGLKHDFDWYLAESKKEIESGEPEDQRCRRLEEPNWGTDPEGKIGPDEDAKPHCWQITEERKAAILHCKRMLTFLKEDDAPCYDVEKITKDESVLVAMLEEADHDKP